MITNCYPQANSTALAAWIVDETGAIFVWFPHPVGKPPAPGDLVELRGRSDPGLFAPIVGSARANLIGHPGLPSHPPSVSLTRLRTGAEDAQWVRIQGVVRSVTEKDRKVSLEVAMTDGMITATTQQQDGVDYTSLIDSSISIDGNASPLFNYMRQIIGSKITFPNVSVVHVLEAAPQDPFDRPLLAIGSLSDYDHIGASTHRIHVRGRVTLNWKGMLICLHDGTRGICAQSAQMTPVSPGDQVDVVGFEGDGGGVPTLTDAVFHKQENGVPGAFQEVPTVKQLTAEQAMKSEQDANVVQIEGRLIGRDLAAADTTLMVESGKFIFAAVLPKDQTVPELSQWRIGSVLRLTGVCSVQIDKQRSAPATEEAWYRRPFVFCFGRLRTLSSYRDRHGGRRSMRLSF